MHTTKFDKLLAHAQRQFYAAMVNGLLTHQRLNRRSLVTVRELEVVLESINYREGATGILQDLTAIDLQQGRVPATAIVVDAETGQPWAGFFEQLRAAQVVVEDERAYWKAALAGLEVAAPRRTRRRTPRPQPASRRKR